MNLFSRKNIFLKIMNGILLLWFVGALAICANNFITMLMPEPFLTYENLRQNAVASLKSTRKKIAKNHVNLNIIIIKLL